MFVIKGVAPASAAGIEIANLDGTPSNDRLVMSRIDNPNGNQSVRDEVTIRISNPGLEALDIQSVDVADGELFKIVGASTGLDVPGGGSIDVTPRYVGSDSVDDNAAALHESVLTITSNAGVETVELAGLAQIQSEGGEEPTVQQIVDASATRPTSRRVR